MVIAGSWRNPGYSVWERSFFMLSNGWISQQDLQNRHLPFYKFPKQLYPFYSRDAPACRIIAAVFLQKGGVIEEYIIMRGLL